MRNSAMRTATLLLSPVLLGLSAAPAPAQDATVTGNGTVLPGTGPGTDTGGSAGGRMMRAGSAEDAVARRGLKPAAFLASDMKGVAVRNVAGESVGTVEDLLVTDGGTVRAVVIDVGGFLGIGGRRIAVEPGAIVLRPGGARFSAVLNMSRDTIAAAQPFDPAKAIGTP